MSFTGCASANKVAYKTTAATQVTVDAAMTGWGDYIKHQDAAGTPVSMNQRAQVKAAYEKYQAAMGVVADAGVSYNQAAGTTNLIGAQAILNTAVQMASACLSDLVDLIRSFGVKI